MQPWQFELEYQEPFQVLRALQPCTDVVFFDSANLREGLGRYSYIACQPFLTLKFQQGQSYVNDVSNSGQPFELLKKYFRQYQLESIEDAPPFQGGIAGLLGYDLLTQLEQVELPHESVMPELALGLYDLVIAFDLVDKKAWIFSSGFPELDPIKREQHAWQRYQMIAKKLQQVPPPLADFSASPISSNFSQATYCQAVQRAKDYILAGDIFEVCLSQRFSCCYDDSLDPLSIYAHLRDINPAPFAAYLNFGALTLLSASPERFLQISQGVVESRPIKGTIKRSLDPIVDQSLAQTLMASEKDKAENAMIVDLLRNDLSKVCQDGSIDVTSFAHLESYATVHHLVSSVIGQLTSDKDGVDLLMAAFPGGSITGAPKVRAMEIISEIEPNNRGPYCGNLIHLGFDGSMDSSILIRTMVLYQNQLSFQAGGAIVLDSDPLVEYQETLSKVQALQNCLKAEISV